MSFQLGRRTTNDQCQRRTTNDAQIIAALCRVKHSRNRMEVDENLRSLTNVDVSLAPGRDLAGGVAELGQNFLIVLTEERRRAADTAWCRTEGVRKSDLVDFPQ